VAASGLIRGIGLVWRRDRPPDVVAQSAIADDELRALVLGMLGEEGAGGNRHADDVAAIVDDRPLEPVPKLAVIWRRREGRSSSGTTRDTMPDVSV